MDTRGNLLRVVVYPAHLADRDGAKLVSGSLPSSLKPRLELIWADNGYNGDLPEWMVTNRQTIELERITCPSHGRGFVSLPRRWIVERTFAWLERPLTRDDEKQPLHRAGWVYLASIVRMLYSLVPLH